MTAGESAGLLVAFVAGLALMLLLPFGRAGRTARQSATQPSETYWPVLCGVENTSTTAAERLEIARHLAARNDVRAAAIRRAALAEECDERVREALASLAPVIGEA